MPITFPTTAEKKEIMQYLIQVWKRKKKDNIFSKTEGEHTLLIFTQEFLQSSISKNSLRLTRVYEQTFCSPKFSNKISYFVTVIS